MFRFCTSFFSWIRNTIGFSMLLLSLMVFSFLLIKFFPNQFAVVGYKVSLVFFSGVAGFWIDNAIFPFARPKDFVFEKSDSFYNYEDLITLLVHACYRRAAIMCACILGACLGL